MEELPAIRDILYEDKWFRIATAVYAHLKKLFTEDRKAAEVIEAAERRLHGLKLEVIEAPLLKIEAAVDREGKIAAARCRVALNLGVETVFEGTAPGYRLEKTASKTAGAGAEAAVGAVRRVGRRRGGGEGGWVERVLKEVRREFSSLPVYMGVERGYVYVKRTGPKERGSLGNTPRRVGGLALGLTGGGRGGSSRWRS